MNPDYAIIIPVQNEADCLGEVLDELKAALEGALDGRYLIAVGLNACNDDSRTIAEQAGVVVGETAAAGYGHGCMAAIDAADEAAGKGIKAYLFFAGDGANVPEDVLRLISRYEARNGEDQFLMGLRTFELSAWWDEFGRALPNLLLGLACAALGGQFFSDLGPLRLIDRRLFERIDPRELTWGWTIEAQIMAAMMGEKIVTLPVIERPRLRGEQKVSGVSLRRSAAIGWKIFLAALRTRFRRKEPRA